MGPVHFRNSQGKVLYLQHLAIDDNGIHMKSPFRLPFQGHFVGELLIDPAGTNYRIAKMSIQSSEVWLEQCN